MQNHLSFSSNWNILHLLWLFDLLRILLYYFCNSIILSCQFTLSKEKKLCRNVTFSTTAICIYSASSTCTYLQITAHSANLAGDKNMAFLTFLCFLSVSHMLAFWGTLFILTIQISLDSLQTFHSNFLMQESYEKCCNWIKSHNML